MKKGFLACLHLLQVHRLMRLLMRRRILVLAYHGFTDEREHPGIENNHGKHLDIGVFESHVAYLAAHYNVVPLQALVDHYAQGEPLPPRTVAITIDDGYESAYRLAYPVLKRHGVPATVFVTTNFVEHKEWLWTDRLERALTVTRESRLEVEIPGERLAYDLRDRRAKLACDADLRSRLKVVPQESRTSVIEEIERSLGQRPPEAGDMPAIYRPLEWAQITELQASGLVSIGGHTVSHLILTRCSREHAREELRLSKELIEARTGRACTLFCYPNGQRGCFDADTRQLLQELGYRCGITTVFGTNDARSDVFELKRLYFDDRGEPIRFIMTLCGAVGVLDAIKRRLKGGTGARRPAARPTSSPMPR